jgi:hypothetical protein
MNDNPKTNEDIKQPTPYRNDYKRILDDPDEDQNTEASATSEQSQQRSQNNESTHDYKKRYASLKSHYDKKLSEWRQEKEDLLTKVSKDKKENLKLPKTQEELEKFKQEYPDVYAIVETVAHMQADSRVGDIEEHLEILRDRERELERKNAQKELLALHPDFQQLKENQDFLDWLEEQPDSIAHGVTQNATDVKWAARTIDLYKADRGIGTTKYKSKPTDAAKAVRTSSSTRDVANSSGKDKIWSLAEIGKLKAHEFEKLEAEIDAAVREGRVQP